MKAPTLHTVAHEAGVALPTVSAILGGKTAHRYREETRRKVEEAARLLNYRPHRLAQAMRSGKTNLVVHLNLGGYTELAAQRSFHIGRQVRESGYLYQAIDAYWWVDDSQQIVGQIIDLRPEGLIISGTPQFLLTSEQIEQLKKAGIALVSIGYAYSKTPCIRYDARSVYRTLAATCLDRGCTRLALILQNHRAQDRRPWQQNEKRAGFEDGFMERTGVAPVSHDGLEESPWLATDGVAAKIISVPFGKGSRFERFAEGRAIMSELIKWEKRPDAILCPNDNIAIGMMAVCRRGGVRIPEELVLSGFDNSAFSDEWLTSLTSVEQPTDGMCAAAMEILLHQMEQKEQGEPGEAPPERVLPCSIVWRDSLPNGA